MEWLPRTGGLQSGAEPLRHGFLRPLKDHRPLARIEAELRNGRIVNAFANMTLLVLGPHHDSPYVPSFDEDMKHYNRLIA
jgi:hypothetical protein